MEVFCDGTKAWIDCPAKVNLFLEVLAKRGDGFHEIDTLMTAISIYDSLFVTTDTEGRLRLTCDWVNGLQSRLGDAGLPKLPEEADNLVYRAAKRLADEAGISRGAHLRLVKRIPSEAGLGGASSDAAAALLALNAFWDLRWSRERLSEVAAGLGSDVPFFLQRHERGATAAVCRGRGERMTPVVGMPALQFVIMKPPEGLSTAAVYRQCSVPSDPRSAEQLLNALRTGQIDELGKGLFNRLQEVAEHLSPPVVELRRACEQLDIWGHAMSGSGTSYFAICRSAAQARQLTRRLRARLPGIVFHASTV